MGRKTQGRAAVETTHDGDDVGIVRIMFPKASKIISRSSAEKR